MKNEEWAAGRKSGWNDCKEKYQQSPEYQIGKRVLEIIELLSEIKK